MNEKELNIKKELKKLIKKEKVSKEYYRNDLMILWNDKVVEFLNSNGIKYSVFRSDVKNQSWYGLSVIELSSFGRL